MSWPIGKSSLSTRMKASADKNGVDKIDDVGENHEVKDEDSSLNKIELMTLGGT